MIWLLQIVKNYLPTVSLVPISWDTLTWGLRSYTTALVQQFVCLCWSYGVGAPRVSDGRSENFSSFRDNLTMVYFHIDKSFLQIQPLSVGTSVSPAELGHLPISPSTISSSSTSPSGIQPQLLISSPSTPTLPERVNREKGFNHEAFVQSTFPGNKALQNLLHDILLTQWWDSNLREPRGELAQFVKRISTKCFECLSCGKRLNRSDRAVDHFRTHIDHRPFNCIGQCGSADWFD